MKRVGIIMVVVLAIVAVLAVSSPASALAPWTVKASDKYLSQGQSSLVPIRGVVENFCGFYLEVRYDPKVATVDRVALNLPAGWYGAQNQVPGWLAIAAASGTPAPDGVFTFGTLVIKGVGKGTTSLAPVSMELVDCDLESHSPAISGGRVTVR